MYENLETNLKCLSTDAQAAHFIEFMLEEQAKDIKETADYVSQLRRVGKGHGVWHMDHEMYEKEVRYMAYAGDGQA